MKKKIIAIGLITAMVVCNSMTVWAADTWTGPYDANEEDDKKGYNIKTDGNNATRTVADDDGAINSGQKDVTGTINMNSAGASYSVTISQGALTYSKDSTNSTSKWLSDSGKYQIEDGNAIWNATNSGTSDVIKVTNKSNVAVIATFKGEMNSTMATNYGITDGSIKIKSENYDDDAGYSKKLEASTDANGVSTTETVTVSGTVTQAEELSNSDVTLGTVTVTISPES